MAAKAKKQEAQTETAIKAIKGFDPDWKCRGHQYEVGKTYEQTGPISCCSTGFHACDGLPFDVWGYYGPVGEDGRLNRFADVTMSGATDRDGGSDSKLASAKITIDAEITLPEFIKRAVAWVIDAAKGKGDNPSGHSARIGSSGDSARIGSSGDSARIGSSGHYARIVAEGTGAVIACAGSATVTAGEGGAICIPYHDGKRTRFAVGYVGEDGIEAGKAYVARDGKLTEA